MGFKTPNETEFAALMAQIKPLAGTYSIVNAVAGRGHDCGGLICDIKKGNKKIATYHDDGWGGQAETHFNSPELKQEMYDFFIASGIPELSDKAHGIKTDVESPFYTNPDEMIPSFVEVLYSLKEDAKWLRKINSKLIKGNSRNNYTETSWKGIKTLSELVAKHGVHGRNAIQNSINASVEKGQNILTSKEYLESLGITIPTTEKA